LATSIVSFCASASRPAGGAHGAERELARQLDAHRLDGLELALGGARAALDARRGEVTGALVGEPRGQRGPKAVQHLPAQVRAQRADRLGRDQLIDLLEIAQRRDVEPLIVGVADHAQVRWPVEVRRERDQLARRHRVLAERGVPLVAEPERGVRQRALDPERVARVGVGAGRGQPRQLEHLDDVDAVRDQPRHRARAGLVHAARAELGLIDLAAVLRAIGAIGLAGVVVEGVDPGALELADHREQVGSRADAVDPAEPGRQRALAGRVAARHARREERAQPLALGRAVRIAAAIVAPTAPIAPIAGQQLLDHPIVGRAGGVARPVGLGAVGRDRARGDEPAAHVLVEVGARIGRGIERRAIELPGRRARHRRRGGCRGWRRRRCRRGCRDGPRAREPDHARHREPSRQNAPAPAPRPHRLPHRHPHHHRFATS
jgi:hypothetical protein